MASSLSLSRTVVQGEQGTQDNQPFCLEFRQVSPILKCFNCQT